MWRGFHSAKFQVKESYVLIGVQKYCILAVTAMEYKISWCQKHQQTLTFPTLTGIAFCLRFNSQLLCTWCRESDVIVIKNYSGRQFFIHINMDKVQIGYNY